MLQNVIGMYHSPVLYQFINLTSPRGIRQNTTSKHRKVFATAVMTLEMASINDHNFTVILV
jgi:ubiquitin C-terminal hydrolase